MPTENKEEIIQQPKEQQVAQEIQQAHAEQDPQKLESVIESNPQEAQAVLKDAPGKDLREEAAQIGDGDKRTDEVSNEVVNKALDMSAEDILDVDRLNSYIDDNYPVKDIEEAGSFINTPNPLLGEKPSDKVNVLTGDPGDSIPDGYFDYWDASMGTEPSPGMGDYPMGAGKYGKLETTTEYEHPLNPDSTIVKDYLAEHPEDKPEGWDETVVNEYIEEHPDDIYIREWDPDIPIPMGINDDELAKLEDEMNAQYEVDEAGADDVYEEAGADDVVAEAEYGLTDEGEKALSPAYEAIDKEVDEDDKIPEEDKEKAKKQRRGLYAELFRRRSGAYPSGGGSIPSSEGISMDSNPAQASMGGRGPSAGIGKIGGGSGSLAAKAPDNREIAHKANTQSQGTTPSSRATGGSLPITKHDHGMLTSSPANPHSNGSVGSGAGMLFGSKGSKSLDTKGSKLPSLSNMTKHESGGKLAAPKLADRLDTAGIIQRIIKDSMNWEETEGVKVSGDKFAPYTLAVKDNEKIFVSGNGLNGVSLDKAVEENPELLKELATNI